MSMIDQTRSWHDVRCPAFILFNSEATQCECGAGQVHWDTHRRAGYAREQCRLCGYDYRPRSWRR